MLSKHSTKIYLGLILLLGFVLRMINLSTQSLWGDEVLSLDISTSFPSVHEMLRYLAAVEVHPPLYYLFLHFWTKWFGIGLLSVKLPSVIFGLGCVILAFLLARALFKNRAAGLIAALIVAVMPFQIEFSQEARPYIMLCFFGMLAVLSLWQYYHTRKKIYLVWYVLANITGLYLHYSYIFILASLAGWGIIEIIASKGFRSPEFLRWFITHSAIFMGFSLWLTPFLFKYIVGRYPIFGFERYVSGARSPYAIFTIISNLVWLNKHPVLPPVQLVITFGAQVLIVVALLVAIRHRGIKKHSELWGVYLVIWLVLVQLVLFFLSPQSVDYTVFFQRHVILISVEIAIFLSWLVTASSKKFAAVLLSVFLLSILPYSVDILGNDAQYDQDYNLKSSADFINQQYMPGDLVIVAYGFARTDLTHFLNPDIPVAELLPINYFGIDSWYSRSTLGFVENEYQSRVNSPTSTQIEWKLEHLEQWYKPQRIWLYGFAINDFSVHNWFSKANWRHVYRNEADIQRVDLYSKQ